MAGTVVVTPAAKATAGLSSSGAPVLTSSRPAAVSATPSATVGDGRAPWDPSATPPRCRVVLLPARVASSHLPPSFSISRIPRFLWKIWRRPSDFLQCVSRRVEWWTPRGTQMAARWRARQVGVLVLSMLYYAAAGRPVSAAGAASPVDRIAASIRGASGDGAGELRRRLRGGGIDDMLKALAEAEQGDAVAVDPSRNAGVGIGLKTDKVGNHIVAKLTEGWPAALSGEVLVGDMVMEVDDEPVGPLSTPALVLKLRGEEGTTVKVLLQRGEEGELVEVCLDRVAQGVLDPNEKPTADHWIESAVEKGFSLGDKASSLLPSLIGSSKRAQPSAAAETVEGAEAGIGVGFATDDEGNFVVSKLLPGGPAALSSQVKKGDVLVAVDGAELDEDFSLKKLVKLLKGPVGSDVDLELLREGAPVAVTLTRQHPVPVPSATSTIAAGVFNSMASLGSMASTATSKVSGLAKPVAGGVKESAGALFSSGLSSMSTLASSLPAMPGIPFSSKPVADAATLVGVGLGIKKNQHGDFMIVDIPATGPAAACGKFAVGDVLQKVGKESVVGMKSAALRDLILGPPGSTVRLSLTRWEPNTDEWKSYAVDLMRQKKPLSVRKTAAPATSVRPTAPTAVKSAVATQAARQKPVSDALKAAGTAAAAPSSARAAAAAASTKPGGAAVAATTRPGAAASGGRVDRTTKSSASSKSSAASPEKDVTAAPVVSTKTAAGASRATSGKDRGGVRATSSAPRVKKTTPKAAPGPKPEAATHADEDGNSAVASGAPIEEGEDVC